MCTVFALYHCYIWGASRPGGAAAYLILEESMARQLQPLDFWSGNDLKKCIWLWPENLSTNII